VTYHDKDHINAKHDRIIANLRRGSSRSRLFRRASAGGTNRTSVSGHGTDSGTCGLAAPCRTFAFALTQTAAGGEIDVLDPAGYGQVTITKAISILGNGAAGINAASGNGVTINAGASDSVHLRGLTIEGLGSGANGILFNTGGNLAIENCVIRDFSGTGINIAPKGSAAVTGVLSNVITYNNPNGINVNGTALTGSSLNVTVVNSVASNSNVVGINAAGANTAKAAYPASSIPKYFLDGVPPPRGARSALTPRVRCRVCCSSNAVAFTHINK
jgi:hypothetical protein